MFRILLKTTLSQSSSSLFSLLSEFFLEISKLSMGSKVTETAETKRL